MVQFDLGIQEFVILNIHSMKDVHLITLLAFKNCLFIMHSKKKNCVFILLRHSRFVFVSNIHSKGSGYACKFILKSIKKIC